MNMTTVHGLMLAHHCTTCCACAVAPGAGGLAAVHVRPGTCGCKVYMLGPIGNSVVQNLMPAAMACFTAGAMPTLSLGSMMAPSYCFAAAALWTWLYWVVALNWPSKSRI